jgi:hypothetical protein
VQKLLAKARDFENMTNREKGAFRAHLTRLLNEVEEPRVRELLLQVQEKVGAKAETTYSPVTIEEVEQEFAEEFADYGSNRRGAFKAKVTRRLNNAEAAEDRERLERLQERISELEAQELRDKIFELGDDFLTG